MNKKGWLIIIVALGIAGFIIRGGLKKPAEQVSTTPSPSASNFSPAAGELVGTRDNPDYGKYLVDGQGRTLYVSKADGNLKSNCNGACAQNWPPFAFDQRDLQKMTGPFAKSINVIKRPDGTYQYAFGQTPLYYFKDDVAAGDLKGITSDPTWSVVVPDKQTTP